MLEHLHVINDTNHINIDSDTRECIIKSLELGKIIFLPNLFFAPNAEEKCLLDEEVLDTKSKNISYDYISAKISGIKKSSNLAVNAQQFMHKYALFSKHLIDNFFPSYAKNIVWGRTSFRPAEIDGRKTSKRKDDTRIHVDAFPATPVAGKRILRVFCNINPYGAPRVWHVGEPFADLIQKFNSKIPKYNHLKANLLYMTRLTKKKRTEYDHYMLNLHDKMKLDDDYQHKLHKTRIEFPANSSWIVYTDKVSHAALSGQHLLEQTFYLAIEKMQDSKLAPISYLQNYPKFGC